VHACPADFAFCGEALAVGLGDFSGFAECLGDFGGVGGGVFAPFVDAEFGGVDADGSILADAVFVEDASDAAGHFYCAEEFLALGCVAHGGVADGAGPDGRDEGTDGESFAGDEVGDALDFVVARFGK
jgi:hypothetical protein